jgi:hypothetical protein
MSGGMSKMMERGGVKSLWRGNMTSVLHRFPYSAINFFVYENTLDVLTGMRVDHQERTETVAHLKRRMTKLYDDRETNNHHHGQQQQQQSTSSSSSDDNTLASHKFLAGAMAGSVAVSACYPLDLVRTRLTTQLEGHEHYKGIRDAFKKIFQTEGIMGTLTK